MQNVKKYDFSFYEKLVFWGTVTFVTVFTFADMILSPIFFLHIYKRLHIQYSDVALVMGITYVIVAVLDYPTSHIADKSNKLILLILGTLTIGVGLLIFCFSTSLIMAIVGIGFRSFGAAMNSGCESGWFVDCFKKRESYSEIKDLYITYITLSTRISIFVSLFIAFFLFNYINSESIFVTASFILFFLVAFLFIIFLYEKKKNISYRSEGSIWEIKPLIVFFKKTITNVNHLKVYGINNLKAMGFSIFVTFWQLAADKINVVNELSILHIIAMGGSLVFSLLLPKINKKYKDNRFFVIGVICFMVIALMLGSTYLIPINKYFFLIFIVGFQIINTAFGVFSSSYTMEHAASSEETAKYFSIVSSIKELSCALIIFLIKEFIVNRIHIMDTLSLLLIPSIVLVTIMIIYSLDKNLINKINDM